MVTFARLAVLTHYLDVAQQLDIDTTHLLAKFGLNRALLTDPEFQVPFDTLVNLLEESAASSGCETFGLRMAAARQMSDLGVVSLMLAHQPTLRDALNTTIQYRHLLNQSLMVNIEQQGRTVILREEVVTDSLIETRQATEQAIGVLFKTCASLLGPHWRPRIVHFMHDAPTNEQQHRRFFGCKVEFSSTYNGLVCLASDLDQSNPNADPALVRYAQRFVDTLSDTSPASLVLEVRKSIYLLLPLRRATAELVAQSMGLTVRTLQRKLEDHGVSFSALVNDVQRELVQRYMQNPRYTLSQITTLLGYAKQSGFTRWFASEFKLTPSEWRRKKIRADE